MSPLSIRDQANADIIKQVRAEKTQSFTVGAYAEVDGEGRKLEGSISYDRKWSNGFGFTAYAMAWWNDASVTPHKSGGRVGLDGRIDF